MNPRRKSHDNDKSWLGLNLVVFILCAVLSCLCCRPAAAAADSEADPDSIESKLLDAENNYRAGKIDIAIDTATKIADTKPEGILASDRVQRDAKSDLVIFQLKAGHPDESARLIREMLITLQLGLIMDPDYAKDPAAVYARGPRMLKDYFGKTLERLKESGETTQIIVSLIDNTVPKDYGAKLNSYCSQSRKAFEPLNEYQSTADSEELKYGDPLTSLDANVDDRSAKPSPKQLDKIAEALDNVATQAQQLPVGDVSAAFGLYRVALLANNSQRFVQGEQFARQSIQHINAITNDVAGLPQVQLGLAYALVRQGKTDEFNTLRRGLTKQMAGEERYLITLARLSEYLHEDSDALQLYKLALDKREKSGNTQKAEWMDDYNELLRRAK
jgi:hypothetical protein